MHFIGLTQSGFTGHSKEAQQALCSQHAENLVLYADRLAERVSVNPH